MEITEPQQLLVVLQVPVILTRDLARPDFFRPCILAWSHNTLKFQIHVLNLFSVSILQHYNQ